MRPFASHRGSAAAALAAGLLSLATGRACAEERPAAVPYRPSVSTPAALSAPGWLDGELGLARLREVEGTSSHAFVYALKLAFSEDWGVRIVGDAFLRSVEAGVATRGGGDTSIIVKRRFAVDDRSAFGLEGGISLPTARSGLGTDGTDVFVTGIYSVDPSDDWHVDLNLALRRFGASSPDLGRTESLWAAAVTRSLGTRWALGAELSGTRRGASGATSQWLVATSYAVDRSVILDLGVSRGLGSSSESWAVFAGATFVIGRLF